MRNEEVEEVDVTIEKKSKPAVKKKGKVGRPKTKNKKDKKVMAYFTESEHEQLITIAESQGYSLSNMVRMAALKQINQAEI